MYYLLIFSENNRKFGAAKLIDFYKNITLSFAVEVRLYHFISNFPNNWFCPCLRTRARFKIHPGASSKGIFINHRTGGQFNG